MFTFLFQLNDYDVYEKHFTVMNYSEEAHLEQMFCHDFIKKFEDQYPAFKWNSVQSQIFAMFKEVFQGACQLAPPRGTYFFFIYNFHEGILL